MAALSHTIFLLEQDSFYYVCLKMFCVIETRSENGKEVPEVFKVPQTWIRSIKNKNYVLYPVKPEKMTTKKFQMAVTKSIDRAVSLNQMEFKLKKLGCKILKQNLCELYSCARYHLVLFLIGIFFNLALLEARQKEKHYEQHDITDNEPLVDPKMIKVGNYNFISKGIFVLYNIVSLYIYLFFRVKYRRNG